jgi:hypothetical protein
MKTKLVTIEELNSVKGLIAKKAIESWRKLPPKTRCYIEIEDMIQDGLFVTSKFLAKGKFDPKKGKLTTILWPKLENFYRRCAETLNANKRFDANDTMIEDMLLVGKDISNPEEEAETREHIRRAFLEAYFEASENVRESMRRWFLQIDATKVHVHSVRFRRDKVEFKKLADKHGLNKDDCRKLMNCVQIRNEVVSRLPEYTFMELK